MNFKIRFNIYSGILSGFVLIVLSSGMLQAQTGEKLYPLYTNSVLQQLNKPPHKSDYIHYKSTRILSIPFFDDFSTYTGYPNDTLWMDNYAYVNTGFPINPPSIGVATLDGLNSYGLAYNPGSFYATGSADTLTSGYIDLSSLVPGDSVALSFYYQPAGLGESPDPGDSLIVEFKPVFVNAIDSAGKPYRDSTGWVKVWSTKGAGIQAFKRVYLPVINQNDTNYYQKKFQFRFRNRANKSGNLDIWNIDYVYLDRGRKSTDTFSQDVATYQPSRGLLNGYTSMPWRHFIFDTVKNYRKNIDVYTHNNSNITRHTTFSYIIYSLTENDTLASTVSASQAANVDPDQYLDFNMPLKKLKSLVANNLDSVVLLSETISKSDVAEAVRFRPNDTAKRVQVFNNYYAYDDGTAETGYGISGSSNGGKVAVKFHTEKPDTLYGIGIHFNQSIADVSDNYFRLVVWKNINENNSTGVKEIKLVELLNQRPIYVNRINRIAYFPLDTPVLVSDSFYIGWEQTTDYVLNVGFDQNYSQVRAPGAQNLFYYVDGLWYKSKLNGIPMIRAYLITRPNILNGIGNISHNKELNADIYPNPAHNEVLISVPGNILYNVDLMQMDGKMLMSSKNQTGVSRFDLENLPSGIYLTRIASVKDGSFMVNKIVKY